MNKIGYSVEPYERRQDMGREEYAKQNNKILHRNEPWVNDVRQKTTFYPHFTTYGTSVAFPEKPKEVIKAPLFGAFKGGDPLHKGQGTDRYIGNNKGPVPKFEYQYLEEGEHDDIVFQKDSKRPIWKTTTNATSMANSTILNNNRNINKERANNFSHN